MRLWILALLCFPLSVSAQNLNVVVNEVVSSLTDPKNGIQQYRMPAFTVELTVNKELNAYADLRTHTIYLNTSLVQVFYGDRGELAFVIAHEIGHIQDAGCAARGAAQRLRGTALQRMCEAAADQIGMQYLLAAGYSPFDAAGVMGKLLMIDPAQSSVLGIVLGRFVSDHPVDVDRVKQLAGYARLVCQDRPEVCRH